MSVMHITTLIRGRPLATGQLMETSNNKNVCISYNTGEWTRRFYFVASSSKLYLRTYNLHNFDNHEIRTHETHSPNLVVQYTAFRIDK